MMKNLAKFKFADCEDCAYRYKKKVCNECDYGEMFAEDEDGIELDFKEETAREIDSAVVSRAAQRILDIIDREGDQ